MADETTMVVPHIYQMYHIKDLIFKEIPMICVINNTKWAQTLILLPSSYLQKIGNKYAFNRTPNMSSNIKMSNSH